MATTDALPIPQKNVAYRVTFPILDADGDLVSGAADLDTELSKDGGTFADATNEATEIATSSGMYYLDLALAEMNYDTVAIIVKTSTSGAKTTPIVLYPEEAGNIRVNVTQISDDGTAATNLEAMYDGTGYAGGSTKMQVDAVAISGDTTAADNAELAFDGTGYGFTNCTVPTVTTLTDHTAQTGDSYARIGAPVGASISADIATVDGVADQILADTGTDGVVIADGGITAAKIATDAVDADALAADAVTEIWGKAMAELGSVPGVTGTVLQALEWLFLLARNKITQTSTTQTLRNDADDGNIATASVSDDSTTATRAEWS